ncbi:hypothetical protein [Roseinatronobacter alkalisoli]|uniref:MarR family transcriptional regulator n=1 Tax=Roseinatronobacter alkalisoli TaxID=3028235 RepID=A0ABT5TED1_9RHOB|nr:hypothetical protein [Roseinatronobacter sp. HJB301]MDD7972542.1 hypothetical protein [Roseinatronobacter sp. HJB301]
MLRALEFALDDCRMQRTTLTYGQLAAKLEIDGPGRIAKLTTALETLMEQDAQAGRPLRAALVVARAGAGLPAPGFFQKAQALGLYPDPGDETAAQRFHAHHLDRLFAVADGPQQDE